MTHYICLITSILCLEPVEELHFPAPATNLGELRSQVAREHRFDFVNRGSVPLEILAVEPSCGCMAPMLSRRRFDAGEKGTLTVKVKPTSQPEGPHSWFVKVRYRCGAEEQTVHLLIRASIRHEVNVSPSILAWSGSGLFRNEVLVADLRKEPLTVKEVRFSSPLVRAAVTGTENGVTRIVLQASASVPPGRHDEMLNIYTDDPVYQHLQVPVTLTGQLRVAMNVSPDRIEHRLKASESAPSTLVRIRPAGDRPIAIARVTADDPAITCTWALGPLNGATLKVQIDSAKLAGRSVESAVRVHVSQPVEEIVVIPVSIRR